MAIGTAVLLHSGPAPPGSVRRMSGAGRVRQRPCRVVVLASVVLTLAAAGASARPLPAQDAQDRDDQTRRIVVSLQDHHLWLIQGGDTLLAAPVAVGRRESFRYGGRVFDWRTPRGERSILSKRLDPVWTVPDWHYYERAANEGLDLVKMVRNVHYPLADGSRLEVRGRNVVRVLGERFWTVPRGREIIIDGVLFVPPFGTVQRQVPGVLGTRALDLGEGYLIHGTNPYNRSSIGTAASHGCIRMHDGDVERLFDLVDVGTPVLIH
jgi:hypothetical protein